MRNKARKGVLGGGTLPFFNNLCRRRDFLLCHEWQGFHPVDMMKKMLCIALFLPMMAFAADDLPVPEGRLSEDKQIALLIQATEQTVQQLKELQAALDAFKKQEAKCIDRPDDAEGLYGLSKQALKVLKTIRVTHVEPYFRPAFIEELEKISKAAANKSIPPIGTP